MMDCADLDRDGRLDYMEFTHRFHSPAEEIGRDTASASHTSTADNTGHLVTRHTLLPVERH